MTFKHKLSHRLALIRTWAVLLAVLAAAGCTEGDLGSLAPYDNLSMAGERVASISPKSVIIEASKSVQFKSSSESPEAVKWESSGGTITPEGTFTSGSEGDFLVVGRVSLSGGEKVDTARVRVVRQRAGQLLTVNPRSAELLPGQSVQFVATATLPDGSPATAKVNWKVSGGTIDSDDNYIAGETPGTYPLIAFIPSAAVSDTVMVTIKPSTRRIARLLLAPATAAVLAGGTVRYTVSAQYEDGSTEPTVAQFSATGGSIQSNGTEGTYTAGNASGMYQVTARTPDGGMEVTGSVAVTTSDGGLKDSTAQVTSPTAPSTPSTQLPTEGVLFHDDFSSGNLSKTANGWSWSGAYVDVVNGFSKDGNVGHSARFTFAGSPDLSQDAWSELRFKIGTPDLREVWATFWVYYPNGTESPFRGPKFVHRNATPTNNKFFKLFESYDPGYAMSSTSTWTETSNGDGVLVPNWRDASGTTQHHWEVKVPWEGDSYRGRWIKLEIYTRQASARGVADGAMRYYRNGQLLFDINNIDSYQSSGSNVWKAGYLFGWANSGFTDTTYVYISDVTFSRSRLP